MQNEKNNLSKKALKVCQVMPICFIIYKGGGYYSAPVVLFTSYNTLLPVVLCNNFNSLFPVVLSINSKTLFPVVLCNSSKIIFPVVSYTIFHTLFPVVLCTCPNTIFPAEYVLAPIHYSLLCSVPVPLQAVFSASLLGNCPFAPLLGS